MNKNCKKPPRSEDFGVPKSALDAVDKHIDENSDLLYELSEDDIVLSEIGESNVDGWIFDYRDDVCGRNSPGIPTQDGVEFSVEAHFKGDQHPDKPYIFDTVTALVVGKVDLMDKCWKVTSFNVVSAEGDWPLSQEEEDKLHLEKEVEEGICVEDYDVTHRDGDDQWVDQCPECGANLYVVAFQALTKIPLMSDGFATADAGQFNTSDEIVECSGVGCHRYHLHELDAEEIETNGKPSPLDYNAALCDAAEGMFQASKEVFETLNFPSFTNGESPAFVVLVASPILQSIVNSHIQYAAPQSGGAVYQNQDSLDVLIIVGDARATFRIVRDVEDKCRIDQVAIGGGSQEKCLTSTPEEYDEWKKRREDHG